MSPNLTRSDRAWMHRSLHISRSRREACPFTANDVQSTIDPPYRQHASPSSISGVLDKVWLLLTCSYRRKRRGSQHRPEEVWCQNRGPTRNNTALPAPQMDQAATTSAGAISAPLPCLRPCRVLPRGPVHRVFRVTARARLRHSCRRVSQRVGRRVDRVRA